MSKRGRTLHSQSREMVVRLYEYFERESQNGGPLLPVTRVRERVAQALQIGKKTVGDIIREKFGACGTEDNILRSPQRRKRKNAVTDTYMTVAEQARVATPTATETMLPWKREEAEGSGALKQSEFPSWASNKEYLAYSSPSATFLGGIEKPKHPKSIIGLFRRESSSSTQGGVEAAVSDSEAAIKGEYSRGESSTSKMESQGYSRQGPSLLSKRSTSLGGPSVLLMEDVAHSDPLGASSRPASIMQGPHRGQCRRGSMLELTGSLSRDAITEEKCSKSLPESERMGVRRLPLGQQSLPREPFIRQLTMVSTLLTSSSSDDSSDENT